MRQNFLKSLMKAKRWFTITLLNPSRKLGAITTGQEYSAALHGKTRKICTTKNKTCLKLFMFHAHQQSRGTASTNTTTTLKQLSPLECYKSHERSRVRKKKKKGNQWLFNPLKGMQQNEKGLAEIKTLQRVQEIDCRAKYGQDNLWSYFYL